MVIRCVHQFIDQNVHIQVTGLGNILDQNLNLPNQRVFRTIKKKENFVFYLTGSTKRAILIISGSLIVSAKFCH